MQELNSRIGYNLYKAGMLMRREGMRFLKPFNITPEQWQVLMILSKRGEMSQREIGEITIQDAPTVSRTIGRMIRSGIVTRKKSGRDRRAVVIYVTEKGGMLVKKTIKGHMLYGRMDKLLSGFNDRKKEKLIGLLKELRACLEGTCGKNKSTGGYHD